MFTVDIDGNRVTVRSGDESVDFEIHRRCFRLSDPGNNDETGDDLGRRIPIAREFELLTAVLDVLAPPVRIGPPRRLRHASMPHRSQERAFIRLCAALQPILDDARSRTDRQALEVQERAFLQLGWVPDPLLKPETYADPFIVEELLKYSAAMGVLGMMCARREGYSIRAMRRWRSLLSPSGRSYKSLNLTLDAMSPKVSWHLMRQLRRVRLRAPIVDPVVLSFVLEGVRATGRQRNADEDAFVALLLRSNAGQIRRAFERFGEYRNRAFNPASRSSLCAFFSFVRRTEITRGMHLVGLLERTIKDHRAQERDEALEEAGGIDRETSRPPIELPNHPDVRFLATVADVFDESELMQHCVHTYAAGAVRGLMYLFHVTQGEDHATAQIDPSGDITAVSGPRNQDNPAVQRAHELLKPWCEQLAHAARRAEEDLLAAAHVEPEEDELDDDEVFEYLEAAPDELPQLLFEFTL